MSLIKKIHIENFMSIANADIEFDDSNIIDLCGYNDSGKSAVIRLIDIMFYNAYSMEQVHFIKQGEDYFKCIMYFDDGVEYERIKLDTGASVFVLRKDGQQIYTNQSGRQVINTGGIPKVISDYLGVVKDDYTKEELNVRRCTDRLFLINTTGGDNYKILNTILQSEALAETSTKLNTDKNKLQQEVVARYNQLSALNTQRKETPVVPEDMLTRLESETDELEKMSDKLDDISGVAEDLKKLKDIVITPKVSKVDIETYGELQGILNYKQESETAIPVKVDTVNTEVITELSNLNNLRLNSEISVPISVSSVPTDRLIDLEELAKLKSKHDGVEMYGGVADNINTEMYDDLHTLSAKFSSYIFADMELSEASVKYSDVYNRLSELADKYNLAICKNCGTVMVGGHTHDE